MKPVIKYFLFSLILILLLFPILQNNFGFFSVRQLGGAYVKKKDTTFDWPQWLEGSYQNTTEEFENENFGFRNMLVRLNNQINFLLFMNARASGAVVGKHNYLFEKPYIDAYYGNDFVGYEKINSDLRKLKIIQDSLQKKRKLFLLVFAAGKASYFPEFIPEHLKTKPKVTNYMVMTAMAKKININYIDFNSYFISQKNKSAYPLYPQFGIHWSNYGSVLVFDSITKYIERKLNINLPDLETKEIDQPDTLRPADDDLIKAMNLLWQPKTYKMVYPLAYIKYDSLIHKKLNSLVMGDSYWWQIYGAGFQQNTFNMYDFWYYNHEIHPDFATSPFFVWWSNYYKRIRNADVIILLQTEATLSKLGNGFIEECYESLCEKRDTVKEELQDIKEVIAKSPDWFAKEIAKALAENIPLDTLMNLDAQYVYKKKYSRTKKEIVYDEIKVQITSSADWMQQIREKAKRENLSVEKMIELDVEYVYKIRRGKTDKEIAYDEIRAQITSSAEWMKQIRKKAKKENLSVEKMIELDIEYVYKLRNKKK